MLNLNKGLWCGQQKARRGLRLERLKRGVPQCFEEATRGHKGGFTLDFGIILSSICKTPTNGIFTVPHGAQRSGPLHTPHTNRT